MIRPPPLVINVPAARIGVKTVGPGSGHHHFACGKCGSRTWRVHVRQEAGAVFVAELVCAHDPCQDWLRVTPKGEVERANGRHVTVAPPDHPNEPFK